MNRLFELVDLYISLSLPTGLRYFQFSGFATRKTYSDPPPGEAAEREPYQSPHAAGVLAYGALAGADTLFSDAFLLQCSLALNQSIRRFHKHQIQDATTSKW